MHLQLPRRPFLFAAVGMIIAASTACAGPAVTHTRLEQSVGVSFQRLYDLQQDELGHPDQTAPDADASCTRSGSGLLTGAGSWTCTVHYPYPDGHLEGLAFDVEVQPIGCYTASGPPTVVGQQKILTADGRTLTNPLFAFDGCFDTV